MILDVNEPSNDGVGNSSKEAAKQLKAKTFGSDESKHKTLEMQQGHWGQLSTFFRSVKETVKIAASFSVNFHR